MREGRWSHSEVKSDFAAWMPKLRARAETLVAGHDFSPQWPGVVRAVQEQLPDLQHARVSLKPVFKL